jgi:glycolate oxidase FAD binding subunit
MTASTSSIASRLEAAIGASQVTADPAVCADYAVDEIVPSVIAKPVSAEEVAEIVRFAAAENLAIIPSGARSKLAIGMPPSRYDIALDMTGLNKIAHYDPGDLTLSVDAGASFNDVAAPLYKQKQFLPLAVPFYFQSTIGGIIASGVDSSLRQAYGTARDFLIGAEFVNGSGSLTKSGGRVVKNVTGYDLHKLLIGSLGTLAVITRLNFRTFPLPPEDRGFVASFRTAEEALELRRLITESPLGPSSLELLSPQLMQLFFDAGKNSSEIPAAALDSLLPANSWHLCISVEGTSEVCDRSVRDLTQLATQASATNVHVLGLDDAEGPDLWHYIGQAVPMLLEASPSASIFKIAQLPSRLGVLLAKLSAIADQAALPQSLIARGCGVVYFALLPPVDDSDCLRRLAEAASAIFLLCAREGASATIPWCPTELKRSINIWGHPFTLSLEGRPDLALMRRLKSAFDPQNILAPDRLP